MSYKGNCLTLIGTASIQNYVFGSNRLAENLGASYAVVGALDHWKKPGTSLQMIYVGGGNAALLFADEKHAREAVFSWSRTLLDQSPGLRVTAAHYSVTGTLQEAYREVRKTLFEMENNPPFGSSLGSLSVVRTCPSTGFAASEIYPSTEEIVDDAERGELRSPAWLSAEAAAKRRFVGIAYKDLIERFGEVLTNCGVPVRFPSELSDLGQGGGAGQIAVVHADGNGIGRLFSELGRDPQLQEDGRFIERLRELSIQIEELAWDAFRATIAELVVLGLRNRKPDLEIIPKDKKTGKFLIPLRPIVFGGDDLTFVTNGRLGLALAARYLHNFELKSEAILKMRLTACCGIAIVPEKFPFSRAYGLAEDLCNEAKKRCKTDAAKSKSSWLDFQLVLEGSGASLTSTRASLYANPRWLEQRPYRLDGRDQNSWRDFEAHWERFRGWSRNRAKRLLEALAVGDAETDRLLTALRSRGCELPLPGKPPHYYFDALEMLDYHRKIDWDAETNQDASGETA